MIRITPVLDNHMILPTQESEDDFNDALVQVGKDVTDSPQLKFIVITNELRTDR